MRILVVGAGGTGGYYGGRLFEAGRDVSLLVRPARAAQLRERGLEIVSPSGDATLHPKLVLADELARDESKPYDLVFLSVKAYALDAAIADFAPAVGPETMIVPVLNGMRHIDALVARFGERPVLGGVSQIAATVDERGRIVHLTPLQKLAYGERSSAVKSAGANPARLDALHSSMSGAVFEARLASDIDQEMWEKWVFLATLGAINCLLRGTIGEVEAVPGGAAVARAMLDESASIAAASGHAPGASFLESTAKMLTAPGSPAHSSMYRDLQRSLRVEVEQILGDLVGRARSLSLKTPLLDAACANLRVYQRRLDAAAAGAQASKPA
jgi:2-dehydropantoate 2-reductase